MSVKIAGTTRLKHLAEARIMIDEAWTLLTPALGDIDGHTHGELNGVLMKVDEKIVEVVVDLVNQGVIK